MRTKVKPEGEALANATELEAALAAARVSRGGVEAESREKKEKRRPARRAHVECFASSVARGDAGADRSPYPVRVRRRRREKKLLVGAVRDLRRRVRRMQDADRARSAVAAHWGPDDDASSAAPPPPPPVDEAGDDWLGAYLRELDGAPDSSDSDGEDRRPPEQPGTPLRVRDLGDGVSRPLEAVGGAAKSALAFVRRAAARDAPPRAAAPGGATFVG